MILLIAIILFIIFLIYSIKPRSEEYTLEGLKLSWKNKASIEGNVTKWIVILKDKSGTKIHEYENSDAGNLKDFTDVTMNTVNKKEFDNRIIGDNTLELYYNKVSSDTKLYTKTVTFTEEDFGVTIDTSKLEEIDIDCVGKYVKVKKDNTTKGDERFACGPADDNDIYYCQKWRYEIEREKMGSGKACTREDNYVITVQWPTETAASFKKLDFHTDPDPNTDQNVSNEPQYYKNIWDNTPYPEPVTYNYTYEFIINKLSAFSGAKIQYIKIDDVLITEEQTTINKSPAAGWDNVFKVDSKYATWNRDGYKVGTKIFTIKSFEKINKIDITYTYPRYAPGWLIKENGETKISETDNRGTDVKPNPVTYTYDLTKTMKIDCEGNWNLWSTCSKTCGGGTQSRNWTTTTEPQNGGAACPSPSTETRDCNTQGCKVDCKGNWNLWSTCSKTCGGGTQSRNWTTTTEPQNGGAACPTTQTQICNTHACATRGVGRTPSKPPTGGGRRRR